METGSTLGALTRPVIGVHLGRMVWPDPSPKRLNTIELISGCVMLAHGISPWSDTLLVKRAGIISGSSKL